MSDQGFPWQTPNDPTEVVPPPDADGRPALGPPVAERPVAPRNGTSAADTWQPPEAQPQGRQEPPRQAPPHGPNRQESDMLNFDLAVKKEAPPFKFGITFHYVDAAGNATGQTEQIVFHCIREAGAGGLFAVGSLVRFNPRGDQQVDINGVKSFFRRIMLPNSYTLFEDVLDRQDLVIQMDDLMMIFQRVMDVVTGRPT